MRPLRSCVSGDVLAGLGEPLERLHGGAGDEPPEHGGERDAADDEQREDQAQAAEQAVDFGERLRELHGAPLPSDSANTRRWVALDGGVAEERLAAGARRALASGR